MPACSVGLVDFSAVYSNGVRAACRKRKSPVILPEENEPKSRRRMTFGLAGLFLVMFVVCVAATGGYYLVKSLQQGVESAPLFVISVTAAPGIILVVFSAVWHMLAWLSRRRQS